LYRVLALLFLLPGLAWAQIAPINPDNIPIFTSSKRGAVPASGGGTANYLRADGTFATPPGGAAITVGSTTISGGTTGRVLYDNAGVLGELSPSVTINGTTCTLAGSCTVTAAATGVTVGTTTVGGGTSGYLLYNNGGTLGNTAVSALTISLTQLPSLLANQLLGSLTATTPSGLSVPSCSAATSALTWTSGVGFGCNTITPGSGTVTSVALTMPGVFSVGGSPVTSSGTLAVTASGTSGGVPYFSASNTMASSAALTANLPVIGGGAGAAPTVGARSGNTTTFGTTSGSLTNGNLTKADASGNIVDGGVAASAVLTSSSTLTDTKCLTWDSTTSVVAQTVDFTPGWSSWTLTTAKTKVGGGGSFTAGLQIGGSDVTSCNAISVSGATNTNTTCTAANTGTTNSIVSFVVSSPSGTVNQAYVCAVFTHAPN
jgi:hypothetical protein